MSIFGTDGIRSKPGLSPFRSDQLVKLARAIAIWAKEKYQENASFLIARDTRQSGSWISSCIKSGLIIENIKVFDAQILPTPGVFYLLKNNKAYTCAIIITASHNPYTDNGIKIINRSGKLTKSDENKILEFYNNLPEENYLNFGSEEIVYNAQTEYINTILSLFSPNLLKDIKIILDTANGATYDVAPKIFNFLGANLITINSHPNGKNINQDCGAVHPKSLQKAVLENKADIGFAFDGDGDRIVAVNNKGELKDGDDILAILSQNNEYNSYAKIVGTIMSNQGLEAFLKENSKELIRAQVGDKYVIEELEKENLTLGGEPSGHIILKNLINTGDGILVALKIIQAIKQTNNWELKSFERFPQLLINLKVKEKKSLDQSPISDLISQAKNTLLGGRLIIRYSGTENLLRIMGEYKDPKILKDVLENLNEKLKEILN